MKYYLILIILILNISAPAYGESEGKSKTKNSILRWLQLPDYGKKNKKLKLNKESEVSWSKPAPKIPHGQMRLEESVALALRHNRTIKSAYLNRISEKYTLQVAEDEFNLDYSITPQYGLSSTGRTNPPQGVPRTNTHAFGSSFSLSKRAKTGASLRFAWANSITDAEEAKPSLTTSWTLSATQPLLRGAGIDVNTVNLRTARITNENNILTLQSTIISTITSIITTYRTYLQTYRKRNIAKQALNRTKKQLKVNKALIKAGRLAGIELIQTQADIAQKEFDLITSRNTLDNSRLTLLRAMNVDKGTKVQPIDSLKFELLKPDYDKSVKIALANRVDYLQALNNLEVTKMGLIVAKNSRLWDLSATGSATISETNSSFHDAERRLFSSTRNDYTAGLSLTIPFGDLSRHSSYVSSTVGFENAKIALQTLKERIQIDIADRIRDIKLKILQLDLARRSRKLSKKKLDVELMKLKSGLTTNFQVVTFQNDLRTSEINETDSIINYQNALTEFDQALGTTLKTWKIELVNQPETWDSILYKLEEDKFFNSE